MEFLNSVSDNNARCKLIKLVNYDSIYIFLIAFLQNNIVASCTFLDAFKVICLMSDTKTHSVSSATVERGPVSVLLRWFLNVLRQFGNEISSEAPKC